MCGIAGYYSPDNFFKDSIEKMTLAISHRGPDAQGVFKEKKIALGHRRLSVLDTSDRANQPMFSHDNNYVIVYNGEVYNYRELSADLKFTNNQLVFNTSSDTETILELFVQKGTQCLQNLNGMFAIAIYDRQKEELVLVRDRIGIKPLYYYWDGMNLAFASEIKALLQSDSIKPEINPASVLKYLHYGCIPAPDSIYKNIYKLEPGAYLKVNENGLEHFKYWTIESTLQSEVISNEKQALVVLSDLLASSVQYQLRSDVPFGVFLSGGIDSSLVAAQASKFSGTTINTFSIGFEENKYDESRYAATVAKYLGTNHHQFTVTFKDAINLIQDLPSIYDEPFADSSAVPTLMVSKMARKHVTVTLSGEGGDELFMGYGIYNWANRVSNPLINSARPLAVHLFNQLGSRYKRIARLLDYDTFQFSHLFSQEQYLFSVKDIKKLVPNNYTPYDAFKTGVTNLNERILNAKQIDNRKLTLSELQSIYDLKLYLPDDLLTKVDRASMRFGLETRV
ncbi:MAG: asparagine synthase (glutamine-hydrolyzing), partial [Bacteroidia bacterium]|nr:asparagine synthase (glutamine-hydrolyzing) [Bacteroidia bacterium]